MPDVDRDPLDVAAREAERVRRLGLRRMWTMMGAGALGGVVLAIAINYPKVVKRPSLLLGGLKGALVPVAVMFVGSFLRTRGGRVGGHADVEPAARSASGLALRDA